MDTDTKKIRDMSKIRVKGEFKPFGRKQQFAAMEVSELVNTKKGLNKDYQVLSNVEIVVYGYLLISYYDTKEKRVIFRDSISQLAALVNIDRHTTASALTSLLDMGLIQRLPGGITTKKAVKKNYIPVPKGFLLSPLVTTSQKAFLLRLAALKKAGILSELDSTESSVARDMSISRLTVVSTVKSLLHIEEASWIYIKDDVIIIDYSELHAIVQDGFEEFYANEIKAEQRLPSKLQLEFNLNNKVKRKPSKLKTELIMRLHLLRALPATDKIELLKAKKYLQQSRLTLAANIIKKQEDI